MPAKRSLTLKAHSQYSNVLFYFSGLNEKGRGEFLSRVSYVKGLSCILTAFRVLPLFLLVLVAVWKEGFFKLCSLQKETILIHTNDLKKLASVKQPRGLTLSEQNIPESCKNLDLDASR